MLAPAMKTRITLLIVAALALASCKAGFSGSIDNPTAATTPTEQAPSALS